MHSFSIPRGVCVLAGGVFDNDYKDLPITLKVSSNIENKGFSIVQSDFMLRKAKTISFEQELVIDINTLTYKQNTVLDIYGKKFNHTDENILKRVNS